MAVITERRRGVASANVCGREDASTGRRAFSLPVGAIPHLSQCIEQGADEYSKRRSSKPRIETASNQLETDFRSNLQVASPVTPIRMLVGLLFLLVSIPAAFGGDAEQPDWADISAIFNEQCVMCHSSVFGAGLGLSLDSYEGAIAGSSRGAVLIPGDAAGSELIRRLLGESTPRMPFLSVPLPQDQINLIIRWIDAGLPKDLGRPP